MTQDAEIFYRTYVGRERQPLTLSFTEYRRWLDNIRADAGLMAALDRLATGAEPYGDLDEGDARIFPGRVFPYAAEVRAKLDWLEPRAQHVLAGALLPQLWTDLGFAGDASADMRAGKAAHHLSC
ncbi:hypothetical protein [Paracoccus pacificus]|uniref:Uncharacterized protein n=1 Tax=Paracoccus pacificus TaxID=1463598 RepID=A0ABW4RBZ4_9RHOB